MYQVKQDEKQQWIKQVVVYCNICVQCCEYWMDGILEDRVVDICQWFYQIDFDIVDSVIVNFCIVCMFFFYCQGYVQYWCCNVRMSVKEFQVMFNCLFMCVIIFWIQVMNCWYYREVEVQCLYMFEVL